MAGKKTKKAVKGGGRRRAKPTKDETVEGPDKGAGVPPLLAGNMPPIKDVLYHLNQIAGYQEKARTASGRVTAAKKAAKEAGIDLKAISETIGLERMDPLDLATYFRQLQVLMKEKGLPVQINLFEPKHGSIEQQASAEGWAAGKAGRTPDTVRWPEGAPGYVEYMRRWNDGQKELLTKGAGGDDADEDSGED